MKPSVFILLALLLGGSFCTEASANSDEDQLQSVAEVYDHDSAGLVPFFLSVNINGRDTGLVAEFSGNLDGTNMHATRNELTELGLRLPVRLKRSIALSAIKGLNYAYDEHAQAIHIDVPDESLLPHVYSAAQSHDFEDADRAFGAVLNYSLVGERGFGPDYSSRNGTLSSSLDGWIFAPFGQLRSTAFLSRPMNGTGRDSTLRLETALSVHMPRKAVTLNFGDFTTSGPSWVRPIRMGGVEFRRDFSLRSDLITDQRLSYAGAAAVPSSVDVFIENNRVFSTQVGSGPFRLEDVPVQGGGDAEIVVRGVDGQISRRTVSFFSSNNLLKKGMADYSFGLGFAREGFGLASNDYGGTPILSASFRYGVTERLTFDSHLSATDDLRMGGIGLTAVPFAIGEVTAAAAASQFQETTGALAQLGFQTRVGAIDVSMNSSRSSGQFADLAYVTGLEYLGAVVSQTESLLEVPRAQDVLSVSVPVSRSGRRLGVSYVSARRASSRDRLASMTYGSPIGGGRGSLNMNAAYNLRTTEARLTLGLSLKLGKRRYVQATNYTDGKGRQTQDISYTRSMGEGVGAWGYHLQAAHREDGRMPIRAKGEYRSRYGEFSTEVQNETGNTYVRSQFDGALAFTGGSFAMGNQVRDGFAVVDLGVSDVPVYLDNRPVARTNERGRVLVNGLNAYRTNRVSVNVADLPDEATLGVSAVDMIPSRGGGQYISFGGSESSGVIVILRDTTGRVLAPGSVVYANGSAVETYVGYDGETWIEAPRASNTLRVESDGRVCKASFSYNATNALQAIIDPVECT